MIAPFCFARIPRIVFGPGTLSQAPQLVASYGRCVLLVTGRGFASRGSCWQQLIDGLDLLNIKHAHAIVSGEPTPEFCDEQVQRLRGESIDVVLAVGGGSVIDAAKAISAMLTTSGSVVDYLEDVGTKPPPGTRLPLIAAPTTAGTGSEATKNAVLSRVGPGGFKKSLRHDNYVPDVALLDPQLACSCPPEITAASGLDAFTQLLESYISTQATPLTDALALSGMQRVRHGLVRAFEHGDDLEARGMMAYAALLSGITLANAGLGTVHGLAGSLGAAFDVPHGAACGSLLAAVTAISTDKLISQRGKGSPALKRYGDIGALLVGLVEKDVGLRVRMLNQKLHEWTQALQVPRLSQYGVTEQDLPQIAQATGNKNNPVQLTVDELIHVLSERL
ncbi:MAG: iron-containing alcohol dehydrogenase [Candidatus Alcyoniella australis]|nr:iron-containing alcohol dehydrogenase [Candidatus Alcyoniella australis]